MFYYFVTFIRRWFEVYWA